MNVSLTDKLDVNQLVVLGRWNGYDTPHTGNTNYAWILHMMSKLSENGVAGFVHRGTIGQIRIIIEQAPHLRYVVSQSQMFLKINQEITSPLYAYRYFVTGSM